MRKYLLDENVGESLHGTVEELALVWGAALPQEYVDQVNYLPSRW